MPRFSGQAGDSDHQCRGSSCMWRGEGICANDDRLQFIAVECEEVVVYPNLYDNEVVGEGGENGGSDGFG